MGYGCAREAVNFDFCTLAILQILITATICDTCWHQSCSYTMSLDSIAGLGFLCVQKAGRLLPALQGFCEPVPGHVGIRQLSSGTSHCGGKQHHRHIHCTLFPARHPVLNIGHQSGCGCIADTAGAHHPSAPFHRQRSSGACPGRPAVRKEA